MTGCLAKRTCLYIVSRGRVARYPVGWRHVLAELSGLAELKFGPTYYRPVLRMRDLAELKFGPTYDR